MMNSVTLSPSTRARSGPTEEFVALCKTLYGDVIDPDDVWDEVIKLSPDQADVNANRRKQRTRRVLEGVALGSTIAGGALGLKEGLHGAKQVVGARRAGKLVPKKAYASLALAGAATGGDGITTGVLAANGKKEKASKMLGGLPPMARVVEGHVTHFGSLVSATSSAGKAATEGAVRAGQTKAPAAAKVKTPSRAYRAGAAARKVATSREGQIGAAAGVTGTLGVQGANRSRKASAGYGNEEYYGKADDSVVTWEGTFSKFDEDQRCAFGWASVTKIDGAPVVDRQGDYIATEDIEKAAYDYVHKSRVGGDMHRRNGEAAHKVSDLIESIVFTDDKIEKMGLPENFPRGWWVGFKIHDEDTWGMVKKGERTGFSIHGKGIRKDHSLDEIMGY